MCVAPSGLKCRVVGALKQGLTPLPVVLKFSAPFGRYRNCHWQFLHPYGVIVLRPAGYRKAQWTFV
jgi:hypothetical protein